MTTMTEDQQLELSWNAVGALPIVSHFLDRLGLEALLARYLPVGDVRALMASWRVIRALLINLCLQREPLYGIGEWAARHDAGALDDQTHIATWDGLCALTGRHDFLYVADSKLCTREQMGHIDTHAGRFITVLPRSRAEDGRLRDWMASATPDFSDLDR